MRETIVAGAVLACLVLICDSRFPVAAQPGPPREGGNSRPAAQVPHALVAPAPALPAVEASSATPPAPVGRLAAIRTRGELLVCIWPDYFAVSFRNPRTGELEGLDIDMARALAGRLGARPGFVETNFAEFMDRIEEGACDIAMMAVGVTPARAGRVAFSKPYMASPAYAVTTRTNGRIAAWRDIDTPGTVVAVAAGTVMEPLMRDSLRSAELMVVRAPRTREGEVLAGRADVFISDFPYTRRMTLMHDWARVIDPPGRFGETLYAYAVPRGDAAWLNEVNAFLERVRGDGSLARAAGRHGLGSILLP
jgi:ABC-type amino acid transport substrate-binding protein